MPSPIKARICLVSGTTTLQVEKGLSYLDGPWLGKSLIIKIPATGFWLPLELKEYSHERGCDYFDVDPIDIGMLERQGLGLSLRDFVAMLLGLGWKEVTA
jgi:hypothetical protein